MNASVPNQQIQTPNGAYVFPARIDLSTVDFDIFNVDPLIEQGLDDRVLVSGTSPDDVTMYHHDGTRCEPVPIAYDPANDSCHAAVTDFSTFAIAIEMAGDDRLVEGEPALPLLEHAVRPTSGEVTVLRARQSRHLPSFNKWRSHVSENSNTPQGSCVGKLSISLLR